MFDGMFDPNDPEFERNREFFQEKFGDTPINGPEALELLKDYEGATDTQAMAMFQSFQILHPQGRLVTHCLRYCYVSPLDMLN